MPLFYLSFCDPEKPKGSQFLGGCIVEAPSFISAAPAAHSKGCNPGGAVTIVEIPAHAEHNAPEADRNRLLSKEEMEERWGLGSLQGFHN